MPKEVKVSDPEHVPERKLAWRLRKARNGGHLTAELEAEFSAMDVEVAPGDDPELAYTCIAQLMQDIRSLGRLPKEVKGSAAEHAPERKLAKRLRKARNGGQLTAEHEAELAGMEVEVAPRDAPRVAGASDLL